MSTKINNKKEYSKNLIQTVEQKYLNKNNTVKIGEVVKLGYKIIEGNKERIQFYEGIVIGEQNRGLGKSFTLRRTVQGIGLEQIFLINSPKIISITKKQSSKVRRAKLYFIRGLSDKSVRLKLKK